MKDYLLNGFSEETIILVGIYNQQFQGTIVLMVFDLQGKDCHSYFLCSPGFQPEISWRMIPVAGSEIQFSSMAKAVFFRIEINS